MSDAAEAEEEIDPLVRTDMHCTECKKAFIAQLDMSVEGDHLIVCPHCRHPHMRKVKAGIVTEDRWSSGTTPENAEKAVVWKSETAPIVTSMAGAFLRERWLNRHDIVL